MGTRIWTTIACGAMATAMMTGSMNGALAQAGGEVAEDTATGEVSTTVGTRTFTVRVTSVDGDTVTAETGTLTQGQGGGSFGAGADGVPAAPDSAGEGSAAPAAPGDSVGAPGPGDGASQTMAPEPPVDDGSTPSAKPDDAGPGGANPSSAPGGPAGSSFVSDGGNITFTLSQATQVSLEFLQGSGDGSLDDVVVGAVLELTLDEGDQALSITVRNLNAGMGFGGSSEVTNGTSVVTLTDDSSISGEVYPSDGDDENALRVDGAEVTLDGVTVQKTGGASSNTENGDFYGQNAGLLALDGAHVTITGSSFTTDAVNGNAVFSYGEGTTVTVSDSTIRTSQNNSGGIQTTGGATTNAVDLDVRTEGSSSAAIRSDRGGGTVIVEGGTFVTDGTGSPAIYSTADITVSGASLVANASEGVVVEGKNSVSLIDCDLTSSMTGTYRGDADENMHGVMIYQSMSGDADMGQASFTAQGGSITTTVGDLIYVTNTDCSIALQDVDCTLAEGAFLRVEGNDSSRGWGTSGANGGDVVMTADNQDIEGDILVDSISALDLSMRSGSTMVGSINPEGQGGMVDVSMDASSTWTLTADSYVSSLSGDTSGIDTNGFTLYVGGIAF